MICILTKLCFPNTLVAFCINFDDEIASYSMCAKSSLNKFLIKKKTVGTALVSILHLL